MATMHHACTACYCMHASPFVHTYSRESCVWCRHNTLNTSALHPLARASLTCGVLLYCRSIASVGRAGGKARVLLLLRSSDKAAVHCSLPVGPARAVDWGSAWTVVVGGCWGEGCRCGASPIAGAYPLPLCCLQPALVPRNTSASNLSWWVGRGWRVRLWCWCGGLPRPLRNRGPF